tara:strand:+ start:410 stop:601 length:192 start_codon:yes stop_codon:yes gene_type:complete
MKIIEDDEEGITFEDTEEYDDEDTSLDLVAFDHEIREDKDGSVWVNILDFNKFLDWFKKSLGM